MLFIMCAPLKSLSAQSCQDRAGDKTHEISSMGVCAAFLNIVLHLQCTCQESEAVRSSLRGAKKA